MRIKQFETRPWPAFPGYRVEDENQGIIEVEGSLLIMTIFSGEGAQKIRTFLDREKVDFIHQVMTRCKKEGYRWSQATLENLQFQGEAEDLGHNFYDKTFFSESDKQKINQFFSEDTPNAIKQNHWKAAHILSWYTERIANDRYLRRKESKEQRVKKQMDMIRERPEALEAWINGHAFEQLIFFKRKGRKIKGYCTACRQTVQLEKAVHNELGRCPLCGHAVTYKQNGRARSAIQRKNIAVIQRHGEKDIAVRYFKVEHSFLTTTEPEQRRPENYYDELIRFIFDTEKRNVKKYEYPTEAAYWRTDWYESEGMGQRNMQFELFPDNVDAALQGTPFQYSAVKEFCAHFKKADVAGYLKAYQSFPEIEYLTKGRLWKMAKDMASFGYWESKKYHGRGKDLCAMFDIDRQDLNMIRKNALGIQDVEGLRTLRKKQVKITEQDVLFYRREGIRISRMTDLPEGVKIRKLVNYLYRECQKEKWIQRHYNTGDLMDMVYKDYLTMAQNEGYDITNERIWKPKDLEAAHDRLIDIKNERLKAMKSLEEAEKEKLIIARAEKLDALFRFERFNMIIRAPKDSEEFKKEGPANGNCVSSYYSKHAAGITNIFFIRSVEEPDKPYLTLELNNNGEIVQCTGAGNRKPSRQEQYFIDMWQKIKVPKAIKAMQTEKKSLHSVAV